MTREEARQHLRNAGLSHRIIASLEHLVEALIGERLPEADSTKTPETTPADQTQEDTHEQPAAH
ncbi:hypothetical protein [Sulfobacillus harzensis]|uniref:Uncharacterized protein n=1 Tax=Sulfobacillus harzensis TaxID=2729629 RepID=A0A7Y0L788_9FIRM|nr:hypothetical protein [Sulfobacillus harzensis]NMP24041.1 hypothetical protein [Sulfobacillus harzensis]